MIPPMFSINELMILAKQEQVLHDHVELIDIYKLLFQASFGPSHMSSSPSQIHRGIVHEISTMEDLPGLIFQDIGLGKAYCRISLNCIDASSQAPDQLTELILESMQEPGISYSQWKDLWSTVSQRLRYMYPSSQFADVWTNYLLPENIPHHSAGYRSTSHPHYRLIKRSLLDKVYPNFRFIETRR